ncbi:polysaccharide pyruvyl transferase family protein [Polyangium jinanense]|uniref:Polysaccharide pyruvyl transferase family protein n=1 Tax=Polyangium jinanense TaxID=2829994 RepID=A0A9X3XAX7_9BACT|nr:polysaccharide pyruvyl transferase family protein [Polyangium jinanense]MDC3962362.1 polysaccharide pyruvyl transferase family protein [Polyangium jinanense]MDC3985885.1 polysaccharide pyruvyl transferase family protein [Polyangium jinanense]
MERANHPYRIGISGSYGGMNLGDEAILDGIITQLRASVPAEITVFSLNPQDTERRHDVDRAVPVRSLTRKESAAEVGRLDLFILGGGGILYDRDAATYLREVLIAKELGVPVVVYAVSAGPLVDPSARQAVRTALNAATVVTVRDKQARRLLEDVGVDREIHLTADPALLLREEPLPIEAIKAEGVEFERHLVGFSVREPGPAAPDIDPDEYYSLLANAADFVIERLDADVVFVSMERTDVQHSHAVVAHMKNAERAEVLRRSYTPQQILNFVGHLEFTVGMRLHFLIFSALREIPFVALPYASKVKGFIEDLEMETPPLGSISAGQLIARLDRSWDTRNETRAKIRRLLPALKDRARETNRMVVDILTAQREREAA